MEKSQFEEFPVWVIVLGAGASVEAGYPLYKELTSVEGLKERYSSFFDPHNDHANTFWDVMDKNYPELSKKMKPRENMARREFEALLRDCSKISKQGLHFELYLKELANENPDELTSALKYYGKVLTYPEYHLPKNAADYLNLFILFPIRLRPVRIVIISFNHDLLVERSCKWSFRYGGHDNMTFRSSHMDQNIWEELKADGKHPSFSTGMIDLIKLHGSINWLRCGNCGYIVYSNAPIHQPDLDFGRIIASFHPCPKCKTKKVWETTIVPPVSKKEIDQMKPMWNIAKKSVAKADFITIAGYSFPEYDVDTWGLLENIIDCKFIEIIDPFPSESTHQVLSLFREKGITSQISEMTIKKYTRLITEQMYGFDPFPNNCTGYNGPKELGFLW